MALTKTMTWVERFSNRNPSGIHPRQAPPHPLLVTQFNNCHSTTLRVLLHRRHNRHGIWGNTPAFGSTFPSRDKDSHWATRRPTKTVRTCILVHSTRTNEEILGRTREYNHSNRSQEIDRRTTIMTISCRSTMTTAAKPPLPLVLRRNPSQPVHRVHFIGRTATRNTVRSHHHHHNSIRATACYLCRKNGMWAVVLGPTMRRNMVVRNVRRHWQERE